jgi:hypothetical protein
MRGKPNINFVSLDGKLDKRKHKHSIPSIKYWQFHLIDSLLKKNKQENKLPGNRTQSLFVGQWKSFELE